MNKQDRQILLKDLCARLPYKVKVEIISYGQETSKPWFGELSCKDLQCFIVDVAYKSVKPYLRPLSSMTEEEKHYIDNRWGADNYGDIITYSSYEGGMSTVELADIIGFQDWLNTYHFDYRGLIDKGLALEAPKGMYN